MRSEDQISPLLAARGLAIARRRQLGHEYEQFAGSDLSPGMSPGAASGPRLGLMVGVPRCMCNSVDLGPYPSCPAPMVLQPTAAEAERRCSNPSVATPSVGSPNRRPVSMLHVEATASESGAYHGASEYEVEAPDLSAGASSRMALLST